jgi:hypothetical protein
MDRDKSHIGKQHWHSEHAEHVTAVGLDKVAQSGALLRTAPGQFRKRRPGQARTAS